MSIAQKQPSLQRDGAAPAIVAATILLAMVGLSITLNNDLSDWAALSVIQWQFSWWAVLLGIAVDVVLLRSVMMLRKQPAVIAALAMNISAMACGLLLVSFVCMLLEGLLGMHLVSQTAGQGMRLLAWGIPFILVLLFSAATKLLILRFPMKISLRKKRVRWLVGVNSIFHTAIFVAFVVFVHF